MPGVSPMASNAYPPVGGVNIILGDVIPDAIQVAVGILAQDMLLRHALAFRRCSDLRLSRRGHPLGDMLATVKRIQTAAKLLVERRKLDRARMVMLFQQPERLSDHFACGVVAADSTLALTEFLQLVSKRDVMGYAPNLLTLALITKIVNL